MELPQTQPNFSNRPTVPHGLSARFKFARWLGWGLCAFAAVGTIWGVGHTLLHPQAGANPINMLAEILFQLFPLAFAVLAALIISRQPDNAVGWLMAVLVAASVLEDGIGPYLVNLVAPSPSPLLLALLWFDNISWTLFVFPIFLILLTFPTGRPPTKRWNWVVVYVALLLGFFFVLAAITEELSPEDGSWTIRNPLGLIPNSKLDEIVLLPWVIALVALTIMCVAALWARYRRGSSLEKAQIKWFAYASALFGIVYVAFLPNSRDTNSALASIFFLLFSLALLALPVAIGIAILRYRLWDIDFVINRSLVYGALTAMLALLFGVSLLVINGLFRNFAGGPLVAVAITAAGFGVVFQSARRALQRFVDRRFYNIQIDYNKTPAPTQGATRVLQHTHFGDYQNLELIGRGGMAEIYKSTHPVLGIPVAIKVLPAELAGDENFRKRFAREAQTVTKLQHPNIIRIFDSGEVNGLCYMVMEYIAGKDLSLYLNQQGRLSLTDLLPVLKHLAEALDYAHSQGLVHRDIKPSNILLDSAGASSALAYTEVRPVLTDFGIAKILGGVTRYTDTGGMVGTFDYIAPEQIQGSPDVDGRADIYSFGMLVYQALTGQLPFQHHNAGALLMAHMVQPPPDPRDLLHDLSSEAATAIQRAMAKKPAERFVTVGEFVNSLA